MELRVYILSISYKAFMIIIFFITLYIIIKNFPDISGQAFLFVFIILKDSGHPWLSINIAQLS